MIDRALLRRLGILAAILLVVSVGAALAVWRSPALAGGLAVGFALGALPFASWAWIASRGLATLRRRLLAALLLVLKLALYAGALYLLVTKKIVDPVGVFVGVTAVVAIVAVGALAWARPRPKETARC